MADLANEESVNICEMRDRTMYGIIDIGSNTIRLNLYKIENDKMILLLSKKNTATLASYIKKDCMTEAGIEKAVKVLNEFKFLLQHLGIVNVYAFATAALRNVKNSQAAVDKIIEQTDLPIVIIEGEREAELDFIGAVNSLPQSDKTGLLIDIGGASTELLLYKGREIIKGISLPLGSLNMYNKHVDHLLPTRQERKAIKQEVLEQLAQYDEFKSGEYKQICGVGGTVRATGKLNNELFGLPDDNLCIKAPNIKKLIKLLENDEEDNFISGESLDMLLRLTPERVKTILPGMIILHTLSRHFGCREIIISREGIREGYLYSTVIQSASTDAEPEAADMPEQASEAAQADVEPESVALDAPEPMAGEAAQAAGASEQANVGEQHE